MRKPTIWVSDLVQHKPTCTFTEERYKLEILDFSSRGILLSCSENKGDDQLCSYCTADLCLWFVHMQIVGFLMGSIMIKGFIVYSCCLQC